MKGSVDILGTRYQIIRTTPAKDTNLKDIGGYVDFYAKIIVCDIDKTNSTIKDFDAYIKTNVRHEIVHAFYYESGLAFNSHDVNGAWALNEEMIDWFAIQGPKIYKAWEAAEVL